MDTVRWNADTASRSKSGVGTEAPCQFRLSAEILVLVYNGPKSAEHCLPAMDLTPAPNLDAATPPGEK
jgi:hypothetical protein